MKGFSDQEREQIHRQLVETGRELFSKYGLKKTTVSELAEQVGIAEGTFYRFFDSKDDLYWAVLETERERVEARYADAVEAADGPREEMIALMGTICDEIETNPLVRASIQGGEFKRIVEGMTSEELEEAHEQKTDYLLEFVNEWDKSGAVQSRDPEIVAGVLRALSFISLHENELGPNYPEIRDLLIQSTTTGLLTREAQ